MNNLFRLLGISLVIIQLALPIIGCKPWESAMTLVMTVDTPQDGATIATSPVTVSGTVNKTAEVKINGVAVPVKGGKFSTDFKLAQGSNDIEVVGTSGKDTVNKAVKITYNPSK